MKFTSSILVLTSICALFLVSCCNGYINPVSNISNVNSEVKHVMLKFISHVLEEGGKVNIDTSGDETQHIHGDKKYYRMKQVREELTNVVQGVADRRSKTRDGYRRYLNALRSSKFNLNKLDKPEDIILNKDHIKDKINFFKLIIITKKIPDSEFFDEITSYSNNLIIGADTAILKSHIEKIKKLDSMPNSDEHLFSLKSSANDLTRVIRNVSAIILNGNEDIHFEAVGLLCSTFYTYVHTMSLLFEWYGQLADVHFHKGRFSEYNHFLTQKITLSRHLRKELQYGDNPLKDVTKALERVKYSNRALFVKTRITRYLIDPLLTLCKKINIILQNGVSGVGYKLEYELKELNFPINYNFTSSKVATPIGYWEAGKKLKYSALLKHDDKKGYISNCSKHYTIGTNADPILNLKNFEYFKSKLWQQGIQLVLLRQIGDNSPEVVGVINDNRSTFHDIDRELFNTASEQNENVAKEKVRVLLSNGANFSAIFDEGKSIIHIAVESNHVKLVKILINEYKINVNAKDNEGCTPLHLATKNGYIDMVKLLINNKADIDARSRHNWTALHFAAQNDDPETIEYLISKGIKVNVLTDLELTPLHVAIMHNNVNAVKCLLRNKYSTDLIYTRVAGLELSLLDMAVINTDLEIIKELIMTSTAGIQPFETFNTGFSMMHFAVNSGDSNVLDYLLRKIYENITFEILSENLFTPLHLAIVLNKSDIVEKLLKDRRTNINSKTLDGLTPLHLSALSGDNHSAARLMEKGATPAARDAHGATVLHLAAEGGHLDLVRLLIKAGADLDAQDNYQFTPISLAVLNNHLHVVEYLLNHDVDLHIPNAAGMTTVDVAAAIRLNKGDRETREAITDLFLKRDLFDNMHYAAFSGDETLTKKLFERGRDVDETDDLGRSVLHEAARGGHRNVIHTLRNIKDINKHAKVDVKDKFGNTPLHLAAMAGNTDVFEYFYQFNLTADKSDNSNNTILHLAAKSGNVDIIKKIFTEKSNELKYFKYNLFISPSESDSPKEQQLRSFVNTQNVDGYTATHFAALNGHEEAVELLVNNNHWPRAESKILNRFGQSPLELAAKYGHWNIVHKFSLKFISRSEDFVKYGKILHYAARDDQEKIIRDWTDEGLDINARDDLGRTPVFWTAHNNLALFNMTVEKGADLSIVDKNGMSLLHVASENGDLELVRYLVGVKGMGVKTKTNGARMTALHLAASNGHIDIVQYLVGMDSAAIDAVDVNKETAILKATKARDEAIVKYLLANNASVNIPDKNGDNCLHIAAEIGVLTFAELLLPKVNDFDDLNNQRMSALLVAFKFDHIQFAEYLINEGAQLTVKDQDENNILHFMSSNGNLPALEYFNKFLKSSKNFEKNRNDLNPIHLAASKGYLNVVKYLDKKNGSQFTADYLTISSKSGQLPIVEYICKEIDSVNNLTSFSAAATEGHLPVVKYLFSKFNTNLNFMINNSFSLLITSSKFGRLAMVKFLVRNGLDLAAPAKENKTVGFLSVLMASKYGNVHVLKYLVGGRSVNVGGEDSDGRTAVIWAAMNGHLPAAKYLLSRNDSVARHRDRDGRSALIWATYRGHTDLVNFLISEYDGDIYAKDNTQLPLFLIACKEGHLDTVQFFIYYKKVTVNFRGHKGMTCLMYATLGGHFEVVKFLLRSKAFWDLKNVAGDTLITLASRNGHLDLIKYFLEDEYFKEDGVAVLSPNKRNRAGHTAIWEAANGGFLNVLKYFIQVNNISTTDEEFYESIYEISMYKSHLNIIKYLTEDIKLDVSKIRLYFDPLFVALQRNKWEVFQYLVSKEEFKTNERFIQKSIQHKIHNGDEKDSILFNDIDLSPDLEIFTLACRLGKFDIVKNMFDKIQSGFLFYRWVHRGVPIVFYAIESGNLKIIKMIYESSYYTPPRLGPDIASDLMVAASFGHKKVLDYLIKYYKIHDMRYLFLRLPNINDRDSEGKTVLNYALDNGKREIVKYLENDHKMSINLTTEGRQALFNAAKKDFSNLLEYLVDDKHIDVNITDENERNVLMLASEGGHVNLAKYLIEIKHLNPHSEDLHGYTPFMIACENGHFELVKYFVEVVKVRVNDTDNNGRSGLMHAILHGHYTIVNYLIEPSKNVCVDCRDLYGNTCLMLASKSGYFHIFNTLLRLRKINIFSKNEERRDALGLAVQENQLSMVSYLIDKLRMNFRSRDKTGFTLLMIAAKNGHSSLVEFLHHRDKTLVSAADDDGNTALLHAALNGHLAIVKYLADRHDDVLNVLNNDGMSPLETASSKGHLPVVQYLVEKKFKFNNFEIRKAFEQACVNSQLNILEYFIDKRYITGINEHPLELSSLGVCSQSAAELLWKKNITLNGSGTTLLHFAALEGKYLIEKGANVNIADNDNKTVLMVASTFFDETNITELILKNTSIDIDRKDNRGRTALFYAAERGSLANFKHLIEKGANVNIADNDNKTVLMVLSSKNSIDIIEYILENTLIDIESKDNRGQTALFYAAERGNLANFKYLIEKGANVNITDNENTNILMYASFQGSIGIIEYILKNTSIDIHSKDNRGRTALFYAAEAGSLTSFKYLIEMGANINIIDDDNNTILMVASLNDRKNIIDYIFQKSSR